MGSSAAAPCSHYETLGLTPAATDAQIAEAFTSRIGIFRAHPMGAAAQVCVAYETLRDPIKRKDYDRQLGLASEKPRHPAFAMAQPRWAPFIASPKFDPAGLRATGTAASSALPAIVERDPQTPVHPKVAAISASLQELARPVVHDHPRGDDLGRATKSEREPQVQANGRVQPNDGSRPQLLRSDVLADRPNSDRNFARAAALHEDPDVRLEELVRHIRDTGRAERHSLRNADHRPFDWRRPAVALCSLIIGAAAVGTLAGLSVKGDEGPAKAESALPVPAPTATRHVNLVTKPAAPTDTEAELGVRADLRPSSTRHTGARTRQRSLVEQQAIVTPPPENEVLTDTSDQAATEPAQPAAVKLPLPSAVIARTIERIGYSCGKIAATSAVADQALGTFRVTCSSGQSYQATPVSGRYHFRRLASR